MAQITYVPEAAEPVHLTGDTHLANGTHWTWCVTPYTGSNGLAGAYDVEVNVQTGQEKLYISTLGLYDEGEEDPVTVENPTVFTAADHSVRLDLPLDVGRELAEAIACLRFIAAGPRA